MFNFTSQRRLAAFVIAVQLGPVVAPAETHAQLPAATSAAPPNDAAYREKLQVLDHLEAEQRYLQSLLADQQQTAAMQRDAAASLATLDDGLVPHLFRLIDDLDSFVQADLPFLPAERQQRLAALREELGRADLPLAEKYRLVIEAYQVEAGYGREVESYAGWLNGGGTRREVNFLRVGRLVLAYQTRDGSETGIWNSQASPPGWQILDARYAVEVARGLRMALKQAAPDWLILPVAAPESEKPQ